MIMLKDSGAIASKGAYLALDGYENKFRTKDFKELFMTDEVFRQAVMLKANEELNKLLSNTPGADSKSRVNLTKNLMESLRALED